MTEELIKPKQLTMTMLSQATVKRMKGKLIQPKRELPENPLNMFAEESVRSHTSSKIRAEVLANEELK